MNAAWHILFAIALVAYFLGAVHFPANLFLKDPRLTRVGMTVSLVGVLCHGVSIILRGVDNRMLPFSSAGDGWSFLAWAVVIVFLSVSGRPALRSLGAFALPAALVSVLVGVATSRLEPNPILDQVPAWELALHVPASILSLGAFSVAFACTVCYLIEDRLLREKRLGGLWRSLPPLDVLDNTAYWLVVFGFCLLTVGMLSGLILAQEQWTGAWLLHPKMYATVLLWLTYAAYLYVRIVANWRGRRTHVIVVMVVLLVAVIYGSAVFLSPLTANH